jgi:ferritin-like metal-binding protein YciE
MGDIITINTTYMKKPMKLIDLFVVKLNALYDIEHVLVKALPKMAKAAKDPELKQSFLLHAQETSDHVKRLEGIYKMIGIKPKKLKCEGIRGIVTDAEWVIANTDGPALDANIVRASQYAEHYEMAGYIGAIAWAHALGEVDIAAILNETLQEEKATDEKLASLGVTLDEKVL